MKHISVGSLIEFKAAKGNLERLGFKVHSLTRYDDRTLHEEVYIYVRTFESNTLITDCHISGRDVDVVYNSASEWMRRITKQLRYWK